MEHALEHTGYTAQRDDLKLQILFSHNCLSSKVLLSAVDMIEAESPKIKIEKLDIGQDESLAPDVALTPLCRVIAQKEVIAEHSGAMLPSQLRSWIRNLCD